MTVPKMHLEDSSEYAGRAVLFLDIDGVLNDHSFDSRAQSGTIRRDCAYWLSEIIDATDCVIVLSSAWRYMMLDSPKSHFPCAMTTKGFGYMLRTHGVTANINIVGYTEGDCDEHRGSNRGAQIRRMIEVMKPERYCVLDDMAFDFIEQDITFVQTDQKTGLTERNAIAVMTALGLDLRKLYLR